LAPAAAVPVQARSAGARLRPSQVPATSVPDVLRRRGEPLSGQLKDEMQRRFLADFSDVRVHTDAAARASAAELGARAYTSGSHVVIGDGGADRHTLAHELTHVLQQRRGPVDGTDNGAGLRVSDPSDQFERAAEAGASPAMTAEPASAQAHSAQLTVQRYTDGEIKERLGSGPRLLNGRLSEQGDYFLDENGDLWVSDSAKAPRSSRATNSAATRQARPNRVTYFRYEPSGKFLKDCLHTAEEIMHQKKFKAEEDEVRSIVKATGAAFGAETAANKSAVMKSLKGDELVNEDAAPDVGEAYLIYETGQQEEGHYEYHAAAVVARDGDDTVTIEVLGGENAAKARTSRGKYSMYSTDESFHAFWKKDFANPVTIVIRPG
jgi:hypothetical protein